MNRDRQPTRSKQPVQRLDRTRQQSTPSTDWQDSRATVVRDAYGTVLPLDDVEDDAYDDPWPSKLPSSARRYDAQSWQQGNTRLVKHSRAVQPIPRRTSASQQQPRATEDMPAPSSRPRRRLHWLVYAGLGAMVALLVWAGAAWVRAEWEDIHNDWTYTQAFRTFSVDQVVGHYHDSAAHPSHFIVQNDKGHVVIIEFPADDPAKDIIYYGPMFLGGDNRTPVTLSFQENAQTGRLDMVLHVQDQPFVFPNTGTKFLVPAAH